MWVFLSSWDGRFIFLQDFSERIHIDNLEHTLILTLSIFFLHLIRWNEAEHFYYLIGFIWAFVY